MGSHDQYEAFCAIVECQSISKAARKLYISQPAISSSLKNLENDLEVKLFFRSQRGVTLTREGKLFHEYVKQGVNIINAGKEKLKELSTLQAGEISVGASDMTLRFFLLPFIEKFYTDFPALKIKVSNAPTPQTLQHLKEGKIDFGVISEPFDKDNANFKFKPVKAIRDILITGEKFRHLAESEINVRDLSKHPFIMLESGTSTRVYIDSYLKDNKANIAPEIELATSDLVIEFIKRGMGMGFIVEDFVTEELKDGTLHKINLTPELQPRQFYIVTHAKLPLTSAAKKLLEFNNVDISDIAYEITF